ncbi:MAG TPA: hypothetical protein VEF33_14655 [Syntrophales bacterium]|nr:hypothetical protein [Syntrophales bacterium]
MKKLFCIVALIIVSLFITDTAFAQTSFKVVWKQGRILGLLVPPDTTIEQLKDLVYKIKQGKKDRTLSEFLPPVNLGLTDKYSNFIVLIFSDPKWATIKKYKEYLNTRQNEVSRTYLNHVVASYWCDLEGKEYGSLGYDDGILKSENYKELF